MAFTRKQVAAAVAGTMSLAFLAGCQGAAPTVTTPSPAPTASAVAPVTPTAGPTTAPTQQPPASGTVTPTSAPTVAASAPTPTGKTVIVSGTVRNEKGAVVEAATVTVKSLDTSVPYTATVTTTEGSYVVNNVPEGANVEVTVTKAGYTSRKRVQSFQTSNTGQKNILDFGGSDIDGRAYFISDYPEIAATEPADEAKNVDPTKLSFKITLSEALDEDSRDAFDKAFAIVPTSDESSVDANGAVVGHTDVVASETTSEGANNTPDLADIEIADFAYSVQKNNTFLGSSTNKVKASWNAAGTEVTYTFDGNLQADDNNAAEYQAVLFTPADDIEDADGNMLGTNATGSFSRPTQGDLLCNAFKDSDLAYDGQGKAWAQTHTSAVMFEVKKDSTAPKLTGVSAVEDGDNLRLELTFSEPMAAYVGSGLAHVDSTVYDLENYSFMVGEKSGDLTSEDLDGSVNVENLDTIVNMNAGLEAKKEFQFEDVARGAVGIHTGGDLIASPTAEIAVEVEPDAPSQVNIWFRDGAKADQELFKGFRSLKARVSGVKDPAGKNITDTEADKNLVSSSI